MRGTLTLVALLALLVPTASAADLAEVPVSPVATPSGAALTSDSPDDASLSFIDIGRVWLDLRGDHALVIIEVRQLDEAFLQHADHWSGTFDVYDWSSKSRIMGDWQLEQDGPQGRYFTYRILEGWDPKETTGSMQVGTGSPGYLGFAAPRSAWHRDDVGYFRTIDVDMKTEYKGETHADGLYYDRENPAVPGFDAILAIAGLGPLAIVVRRRSPKG